MLIGANAIIRLGYIRNTIDLDLLVPEDTRSGWLDVMGDLNYRYTTAYLLSPNSNRPILQAFLSI